MYDTAELNGRRVADNLCNDVVAPERSAQVLVKCITANTLRPLSVEGYTEYLPTAHCTVLYNTTQHEPIFTFTSLTSERIIVISRSSISTDEAQLLLLTRRRPLLGSPRLRIIAAVDARRWR